MTRTIFVAMVLVLCLSTTFDAYGQHPAVVINEIMYFPSPGQTEWIELYNTASDAVNIQGWILHDGTSARPVVSDGPAWIPPHSFLVVARDATILEEFADTSLHLIIMPKLPALNNSGDDITLLAPDSQKLDIVRYQSSWGGTNGFSLERLDPGSLSSDPGNWGSSTDREQATPGRRNSIAIRDFDLAIGMITPFGKTISALIRNTGLQKSSAAALVLFDDRDNDSIAQPTEEIDRRPIPALARGDSISITFSAGGLAAGFHRYIFHIESSEDETEWNNVLAYTFFEPFKPGSLSVNEIMFAPLNNQAEWIEYLNVSKDTIDACGFWWTRKPSGDGKRSLIPVSPASALIPPGGYFVLASDSSILHGFPALLSNPDKVLLRILKRSLSLSNEGDESVLLDPGGSTIDSVRYFPEWHNPNFSTTAGRSLERLNFLFPVQKASSWSTCTRPPGGSPGERNSVFTEEPAEKMDGPIRMKASPNPFSPDGDGYEDFCVLTFQLASAISQIRVRIFDTEGRLVRTIANNQPSGRAGEMIWDGLDDAKQRLRIGMYIALLEAVDPVSRSTAAVKCVLVIASKL